MTILFGHPTGNPNSHHAALAHFELGRLEAFCVPWMPSRLALGLLAITPGGASVAERVARRRFEPLAAAPKIQGRVGEWRRLLLRTLGSDDEGLAYEANDWLMGTMARVCRRQSVTGVHAYEDCALWQFEVAKRMGKACIYDLPIAYFPAWVAAEEYLMKAYADWLPTGGLSSRKYVRPEQKRREMELADLVLVPGTFVEKTVQERFPEKPLARASYGVDLQFWRPESRSQSDRPIRFLYAGQHSLRKGTPLLLDAWSAARLSNAELELVGSWKLAENRLHNLPPGVVVRGPCSPEELRKRYLAADVFVFPSFFEGFGLVLLEAMACGLPAIASEATAGADVLDESCGEVIPTGALDALVESLRRFSDRRDDLLEMGKVARARAERYTWPEYRRAVAAAVAPFA